jgi:transposase
VNTIEEEAPLGRRRRRRYSVEFKAQVVAACQGPGVSLAAIALHHKLNPNLVRRWVEQAERNDCVLVAHSDVAAPSVAAPASVPLPLDPRSARPTEIRIEVRRADRSMPVSWRLDHTLIFFVGTMRSVLVSCFPENSGQWSPHYVRLNVWI